MKALLVQKGDNRINIVATHHVISHPTIIGN